MSTTTFYNPFTENDQFMLTKIVDRSGNRVGAVFNKSVLDANGLRQLAMFLHSEAGGKQLITNATLAADGRIIARQGCKVPEIVCAPSEPSGYSRLNLVAPRGMVWVGNKSTRDAVLVPIQPDITGALFGRQAAEQQSQQLLQQEQAKQQVQQARVKQQQNRQARHSTSSTAKGSGTRQEFVAICEKFTAFAQSTLTQKGMQNVSSRCGADDEDALIYEVCFNKADGSEGSIEFARYWFDTELPYNVLVWYPGSEDAKEFGSKSPQEMGHRVKEALSFIIRYFN